jgi:hypothetical protein
MEERFHQVRGRLCGRSIVLLLVVRGALRVVVVVWVSVVVVVVSGVVMQIAVRVVMEGDASVLVVPVVVVVVAMVMVVVVVVPPARIQAGLDVGVIGARLKANARRVVGMPFNVLHRVHACLDVRVVGERLTMDMLEVAVAAMVLVAAVVRIVKLHGSERFPHVPMLARLGD